MFNLVCFDDIRPTFLPQLVCYMSDTNWTARRFHIVSTFLAHLKPIGITDMQVRRLSGGGRHQMERGITMTSSISSTSSSVTSAMLKQMQEEMFKKADKNGDGAISSDEMSQMASSGNTQGSGVSSADMFSQIDSDSDGAISRLESDAAIAKMAQQGRPQGPPPPKPEESEDESSINSLLEELSSALESGDTETAQEALAALQEQVASDGSTSANNPFLKDLESLSKALESGSTDEAETILAGIEEKISSQGPPPPKPGEGAQAQNSGSEDSLASTLQALLETLEEDQSGTAGAIDSELKKLLTSVIESYLQQSSASYGQSSSSGQISSTLYA